MRNVELLLMGRNDLKLEIRDLSSERQPNNCKFLISHSTLRT